MKSINRNITLAVSNSGQYEDIKSNQIPGGNMTCVLGEWSHLAMSINNDSKG